MTTNQIFTSITLPFGSVIKQNKKGFAISEDISYLIKHVLTYSKDKEKTILDLGCGCGIVGIMMKYYRPDWQYTGIEIQTESYDLACENAHATCSLLNLIQGDFRKISKLVNPKSYQLIVSNPPYFKADSGILSPNPNKAAASHEIHCTMENVLEAITFAMHPQGIAFVLYPQSRNEELYALATQKGLQVKQQIPVSNLSKKQILLTELIYAQNTTV